MSEKMKNFTWKEIVLLAPFFYIVISSSFFYLLGKEGYVFGSVGLSACLWTTLLKKL